MSNEKKITNIEMVYAEKQVNHKLKTDIKLIDRWKEGRKYQPVIVLKDMDYYMVQHLAEVCLNALEEIKSKIDKSINEVRNDY